MSIEQQDQHGGVSVGAARRDLHAGVLIAVTQGDYTTPSCQLCEAKMEKRPGPRGEMWTCTNPRCGETQSWPEQLWPEQKVA